MLIQRRFVAAISICCLSRATEAIILDASCNGKSLASANSLAFTDTMQTNVDKLQPAFTEAFRLAAQGAADLTGHMSPDVENLAGWLFGMNEAEAQRRLGNVQRIPATFSTNIRDLSNLNDVVVYCNMDRYQTSTRPDGALYDPNTGKMKLCLLPERGLTFANRQLPSTLRRRRYDVQDWSSYRRTDKAKSCHSQLPTVKYQETSSPYHDGYLQLVICP